MSGYLQHQHSLEQPHRRKHRTGRVPKYPSFHALGPSANRRLYDPRRWHKHKHTDKKSIDGGQPPAGWVLVWAGRFKGWRRRWFVAHSPGLLLYYKNSDQLGRPGCINLQGADVRLTSGKERHFKIRKGSRVYHLRALNKETRQAWLETINRSIDVYEKSWKKAGMKYGTSVAIQGSMPSHLAQEWEEQEKELDHRLAQKLQEIEPVNQAFLQQLQALQQSLSVICGSLGFANQFGSLQPASVGKSKKHFAKLEQSPSKVFNSAVPRHVSEANASKCEGGLPPVFTPKKHGDIGSQVSLMSSISEPVPGNSVRGGSVFKSEQDGEPLIVPEYDIDLEQANCIGRDIFRRRRNGTSPFDKGHCSDTEVLGLSKYNGQPAPTNKDRDGRVITQQYEVIDRTPPKSLPDHNSNVIHEIDAVTSSKHEDVYSLQSKPSNSMRCNSASGHLQGAWNALQITFAEVLKEQIQRVIELEAENAVLQQSLAWLPQQTERRDIGDHINSSQLPSHDKTGELHGSISEDDDDDDTEDDISIGHSEVTNEDYFEALEVLNQHDFIIKASSAEEIETLVEKTEAGIEIPEESDFSEVEIEDYELPRDRLPTPRPLSRGFSLWSVLKNAIGKDLNRITMPATINEPLSVLQRSAEELQYRHLIDKASHYDDSIERLAWVSAFACAAYHGSPHRDAKPFNPLLGETYEWQASDGTSRFITEQVSHHPPVLAYYFENMQNDYCIYGEVEVKNKFWGKSVEVLPAGLMHLRIPKFRDHFTWSKVTTCIHNVVVGKLWIDNYGDIVITNHTTGESSRIRIQKATSGEQGRLTGKIYDKQGVPQCSIYGNYMKEIWISPEPSWSRKHAYEKAKCIWKCPDRPEDYEQQYCFSRFAITLNELTPKLRDSLPPTDSRFRPDQRALEDGDLEKATPEKLRLEEKQREARRVRKEQGVEWKCMWFQPRIPGVTQVRAAVEGDEIEPTWVHNGKYWCARERRDWGSCPDIM